MITTFQFQLHLQPPISASVACDCNMNPGIYTGHYRLIQDWPQRERKKDRGADRGQDLARSQLPVIFFHLLFNKLYTDLDPEQEYESVYHLGAGPVPESLWQRQGGLNLEGHGSMSHGFREYTTGRIRADCDWMELDDSWHFRGVLQSHAAVIQVCASAFTLMHFKKAYITQTRTHTLINKQTEVMTNMLTEKSKRLFHGPHTLDFARAQTEKCLKKLYELVFYTECNLV